MAAGDLCVIGDLKAWLGIPIGSSNDDPVFTKLISNVSAWIFNYLNRPSSLTALTAYIETRDGNDGVRLVLQNYPVTAVASLLVNKISIPASDGVSSGFVFDQYGIRLIGASAVVYPSYGTNFSFTRGFQNVVVNYTAGFAAIPADLNQAAVELCALRYRRRGWIGLTQKHTGIGESATFSDKLPDDIKQILEQYKRRIPVGSAAP